MHHYKGNAYQQVMQSAERFWNFVSPRVS